MRSGDFGLYSSSCPHLLHFLISSEQFLKTLELLFLKYNFLHNKNGRCSKRFESVNSVEAMCQCKRVTVHHLSGACVDITQFQQLLCHLQIIGALSSRQRSKHHWRVACLVHIVGLT